MTTLPKSPSIIFLDSEVLLSFWLVIEPCRVLKRLHSHHSFVSFFGHR